MASVVRPGSASPRDEDLRLARRIDWRFLLATPALGDVIVAGDPGIDLRAALTAHAVSVRDLDGPADGSTTPTPAERGVADVAVVAGSIPAAALARCAAALQPDGWLVAELPGLAAWRPGRPIRDVVGGVDRLIRQLGPLGFGSVSAYLVWPDHARTNAFVPLGDEAALSAWAARRLDDRLSALARRAGALAAGARLTPTLAPAVTVIARRCTSDALPGPATASWVAARLGAAMAGVAPSLILLTPRFRASAHVVCLADLDASPAGSPRAVLKAARLDGDDGTIRREAAALEAVGSTLGAAGLAPGLLALDADSTPPYLVESGVIGHPLDPAAVRRDRGGAARGIAALAARMPAGEHGPAPLGALVGPALLVLRERSSGSLLAELLDQTEAMLGPMLGAVVPTVVEHGDLAHPNLIRTPGGAIGAVDWERSVPHGLPVHDLVMGLAYVAAAARRSRTPVAQAAAFRDALVGEDPWLRDLIAAECTRLGIDPAVRPALLVAPWLRTAAWLAERTEPGWWQADRSVALWRAMLIPPRLRDL